MKGNAVFLSIGIGAALLAGCTLQKADTVAVSGGNEYHVSPRGNNSNDGSKSAPVKTIAAAAGLAQPGDTITVHEGVYRERIDPPRGGISGEKRIVYRAAPGEKVVIKGSELIKGWKKVKNDTWEVTLSNDFFGDFNPYADKIQGDWFSPKGRDHHTGAVYLNGHWLTEAAKREAVLKQAGENPLWFAEVDETQTTILAQFKDVNPNRENVEINVRRAVFYPSRPGINYITVRGFTLEQAAPNWAPPTAEQVGLIGTHWSKGWIIENNTIRYSVCTGITLGKYGDEWDNRAQSAKGYVGTIKRALKNGWSKENIGHHTVRNNEICHCEQAGIVGSMGAVFSTVSGNVIHDIHVRRLFTGAEMAGIKFHGAIDTVIKDNHIYRCGGHGGIWLDWMTQGTRVTGNLLHDNMAPDLFVEVNHGPFLVDNNIFLSPYTLLDASGGGAYVHNLVAGAVRIRPEKTRSTPFHKPHSTELAGLHKVLGDDERFFNNLLVGHNGLKAYGKKATNLRAAGNVFLKGAEPSQHEKEPLVLPDVDPAVKLLETSDGMYLQMKLDKNRTKKQDRPLVTTKILGKAEIPDLPYEQPDGSPYRIDTGYLGRGRNAGNPFPGPFAKPRGGKMKWKVWPKE